MDSQKSAETPQIKLHFLDYWRIIRIRKAVILSVFFLVVLTTFAVTWLLPESFSSHVRIAVSKDEPDISGLEKSHSPASYDPYFLQTQFEIIQSSSILYEVIKRLDLNRRWSERYSPDHMLRTEETYQILRKQMSVKQSRNTSLIEIWVFSTIKEEAAEIANAIAEVYKDSRLDDRQETVQGGIEILYRQLQKRNDEVAEAQKHVSEMRIALEIPELMGNSLSENLTSETEIMRRREQERITAEIEFLRYDSLLQELKQLSRIELPNSLTTAIPDQNLNLLLQEQTTAEQRVTALLAEFTFEHHDVQRAEKIREKVSEQVQAKVDGIMLGLEALVSRAKRQLDDADAKAREARNTATEMAGKYRPYFDAKRDLENSMRVRDALQMRIAQEEVELALPRTSIVKITDRAEPGLRPVRPNKPWNIALGVIFGLIVGVGLAFFIEYLDTSVKTIDDVERALQAPVLGVIPQNVGALLYEGPESPHAEAYRVLRTNILFSRGGEQLNTMTVVSGGVGEGKSTTLINLATIFAQNGQRVLVVDSDLRRPSLHKVLKITNSVGLTNFLLKQNTLEEVIQTTSMTNLDFMASGKLPSSSMGILSSQQMKDMIIELKRRYDFVFFDSPPIMGVSDASILASEVDMVLQVIQYRRYPQPMTIRAKQMIQKVGGNLLGIVLNNINMSQDENYYYYSGYYYDYYSKRDDDTPVKEAPAKKPGKEAEIAKLDIESKY